MKPLELILLVDDDETTNFVNQRTIRRTNVAQEIKIFKDGEQAIHYLKAACNPDKNNAEKCPDLIFLDIKMPVMDGFEFLEEYKKLGLNSSISTKIMMLSSSASFYDLKRIENYTEVTQHFSKPLTDQDVKEIIREYFPERAT